MEVVFGKGQSVVPKTETATNPQTAKVIDVEPVPATVPAVIPSALPAPTGLVLGDKLPDFSEIILPRINIVQNIGKLKDVFDPGSVVLGQQVILFTPPRKDIKASPPTVITVLGFRPTRFCEKTQGGIRGEIVNTETEVRNHGGTLDYQEWKLKKDSGMKRFEPLADALCLIERPEHCADDDTVFIYEASGKKYALALWGMRGVIYTAGAKKVFFTQRSLGCLRKGYPTQNFAVSTREEKYQTGNTAWIPICIPNQKSTDEFIALVKALLTGATQPMPSTVAGTEDAE